MSEHSDKLKAERQVMENYGVTRSQARDALNAFNQRIEDAQTVRAATAAVTTGERPVPATTRSETATLPGKGFAAPGTTQGPPSTALSVFDAIVVEDGVAKYATVNGSVGDVVT